MSFEGAYGNLKRLYDKAAKMYHQLKKCETRKLSPSKKRYEGKENERFRLRVCSATSGLRVVSLWEVELVDGPFSMVTVTRILRAPL